MSNNTYRAESHPAAVSNSVFKGDIFNGKVLFCTGGGSGICQKIVEAVMRHSLQAAIDKCVEEFGRIDFVVAGAAGNYLCPIDQLSSNGFKSVVDIDLAALPSLKQTKGSFLSISATLHYVGTPLQAHVSAAKAGVDALSQAIAVEFGPHGIRSNVIAPGPISGTEGFSRLSTPEILKNLTKKIPLQRVGTKDDIANSAIFLFSPAASFITGAILVKIFVNKRWKNQLPFPQKRRK
ncbi:2,4-dienoyl-CoA reductase [Phakopsora pachyrhizi]|uniref:2,4-dienoyl-CoA reductase [(3E)-enoyl-CoA-producing] n=1 Tax=Phakopsora pachyrhizi TaxID=170000 RepID=A0AAV0BKW3_PHAPC|nr:2,4-dienoyl-CoA reductase [Phakopsora pachyrhizi]